MKSQWCILRFSNSGLFRRLYLPMTRTWPEAIVMAAVVALFLAAIFNWWLLLELLLVDATVELLFITTPPPPVDPFCWCGCWCWFCCCCCCKWYGGGGVRLERHCKELPGLPGSELGGVKGGTYMSRDEADDEGGEQKLGPPCVGAPNLA